MLTVSCIYTETRQKVTRKVKKNLRNLFTETMVSSAHTQNEYFRHCQQAYIFYPICAKILVLG